MKRFLSPQVAQLVSSGDERVLSHRRGSRSSSATCARFTAFSKLPSPGEVMAVLRDYHKALGALIDKFEGTVERFAGDGLLVPFNDPLPCPEPSLKAVRMATEMRDDCRASPRRGAPTAMSSVSIGIAHGYATLGCIGFEGRFPIPGDRTVAICPACATRRATARFWSTPVVHAAVQAQVEIESAGELALKDSGRPVPAFNVRKCTHSFGA